MNRRRVGLDLWSSWAQQVVGFAGAVVGSEQVVESSSKTVRLLAQVFRSIRLVPADVRTSL